MSQAFRTGADARFTRMDLPRLGWTAATLVLALLPLQSRLSWWIWVTIVLAMVIRLALAAMDRGLPPAALRLAISGSAIVLLFLKFHTFNGIDAGSALLALMAGLKFLEARSARDVRIIVMIVYFLCLASLLTGTSFALLFYLVGVSWLATSVLLCFTTARPTPSMPENLRFSARLLGLALPLAVALWLFFPRFSGPLWQLPGGGESATSGLSDRLSPGDLSELSLSDEVAMRVRFAGAVPPPAQRYWRGLVLDRFDGRSWTRSGLDDLIRKRLPQDPDGIAAGPVYRYTVSLEPHPHGWLLALEHPFEWDLSRAYQTSDRVLLQPDPVNLPLDYTAESDSGAASALTLDERERRRLALLPGQANPRTRTLAHELRSTAASDAAYAQSVLDLFRREDFRYTLTPLRLAQDAVDEFMFETRKGFCEHFASAFAVLMRAAGVPARVVIGYQGGTFNRFGGYWIIRQSDAHAWDEIWLEGLGWVRVDPTAAIAPDRIERGSSGVLDAGEIIRPWERRLDWLGDLGLRLDQMHALWRDFVLRFDQRRQFALLEALHVPTPDSNKLVLCLAAALSITSLWLMWQMHRSTALRRQDPVQAEYLRLKRRLAALGVDIRPQDTALAIASTVQHRRPMLAHQVAQLCDLYIQLRYGRDAASPGTPGFQARLRRLRRGIRTLSRRGDRGFRTT